MRQTKTAFRWISRLLKKNGIGFVVFGGFAARIYGAGRELADIDLAVRARDLDRAAVLVGEHAIRGPKRYRDRSWDSVMMTVGYAGQEMDIIDSDSTRIFDKSARKWVAFVPYLVRPQNKGVMGMEVKLVRKDKLMEYKGMLGRGVDIEDVKLLA